MANTARYFPVSTAPYRMEAKLSPLGRDFGNGDADGRFFHVDDERESYLEARRSIDLGPTVLAEPGLDTCHRRVASWMSDTLAIEHPLIGRRCEPRYESVFAVVQEDFAVMHRSAAGDRAIAMFVSFPSGWRPERALGASFGDIHGPVPDFADRDEANRSMMDAMIERGPYTRFVWTISADDNLDHHPERGCRGTFTNGSEGWLRVERQVTVPFPDVSASLFLIRTYLYPFSSLARSQRSVLATALSRMPQEVAAYKGLGGQARSAAMALLGAK